MTYNIRDIIYKILLIWKSLELDRQKWTKFQDIVIGNVKIYEAMLDTAHEDQRKARAAMKINPKRRSKNWRSNIMYDKRKRRKTTELPNELLTPQTRKRKRMELPEDDEAKPAKIRTERNPAALLHYNLRKINPQNYHGHSR